MHKSLIPISGLQSGLNKLQIELKQKDKWILLGEKSILQMEMPPVYFQDCDSCFSSIISCQGENRQCHTVTANTTGTKILLKTHGINRFASPGMFLRQLVLVDSINLLCLVFSFLFFFKKSYSIYCIILLITENTDSVQGPV